MGCGAIDLGGEPMKRLGIALFAAGIVGFAHAADLPTTKAPAECKAELLRELLDLAQFVRERLPA